MSYANKQQVNKKRLILKVGKERKGTYDKNRKEIAIFR